MPTTQFPMSAHRFDAENGYMTVQQMVYYLRDVFDKFVSTIQIGTATVPPAANSVVVTIAAAGTYALSVTPLSDPGGRWWVTAKSATGFTINLQVAAGGSGVAFDWIVKGS
jgi:hypothetical protein